MNRNEIYTKILSLVLTFLVIFAFSPVAQAASLTALSDTMSRLKNSTGTTVYSNHTVSFTLGGSTTLNASETIVVDFDNDFGVTGFANSDAKDYDITVGGTEESIVASGGCASNDAIEITTVDGTEKTFTFTACSSYTAGSAGAVIVIEIGTNATSGSTGDTQLSNPTASQTALIAITAAGDTGTIAVAIIDDDQIPVTASVNPTITFAVTTTTLALGILDSGLIQTTSANNIQIGTNGSGGYTITVRGYGNGTNDGLFNSGANKLIGSAGTTLSAGTEGYGAQCQTSGSPSGACAAGYNYWASEQVGELAMASATFASYGSKPSATDTFQIRVKAAVSTSTDAGNYTDTITLIGTANF